MIKKIALAVIFTGVSLSAGLIEDGIEQARKGNNTEALQLFEKACSQTKTAQGCYYSGQAYAKGTIVKKDMKKALSFYTKSCELGYTDGCMSVGSDYFYGRDVEKDLDKARIMFTKACEQGSPNGCFLLGNIYDLGRGIKRDLYKAQKRYTQACKYGSKMGCKYQKELDYTLNKKGK